MLHVKSVISKLISFLAGEICLSCGESFAFICDKCIEKLPFNKDNYCQICASPLLNTPKNTVCGSCLKDVPPFRKIYSPFIYDGVIKTAIQEAKFNNKIFYFKKLFDLTKDDLKEKLSIFEKYEIIIPIPVSKKRLYERGYNQSVVIAKLLSLELKIPVATDILVKTKDTLPQSKLGREERFTNIKNVFSLKKEPFSDKVILVDDIVTTTATVREAVKILKRGGVNDVIVYSLARAKE